MPTFLEIHETVSYALAEASGSARHDNTTTLQSIVTAIQHAEVTLERSPLETDVDTALPEAWFIAWGSSMEDGYSFYVVPKNQISPEMEAFLKEADGVALEYGIGGTSEINPDGWRAWQIVALTLGLSTDPEFDTTDYEAEAEIFAEYSIRDPRSGSVSAEALHCRFVGITHGYEFL